MIPHIQMDKIKIVMNNKNSIEYTNIIKYPYYINGNKNV